MIRVEVDINELPQHLMERSRLLRGDGAARGDGPARRDADVPNAETASAGRFVLYWMCSAIRTEENPALDVARLLASRWHCQLLVYQSVSESWRYASDRHHTFIMQGARDVQMSCSAMGLSYAFHAERPGQDDDYLVQLAESAVCVVTEDLPTDPVSSYLRILLSRIRTAVIAVDTACVVPMQLVGRAFERAFDYRNKTKKLYAQRVSRDWPRVIEVPSLYDLKRLPFQPVDFGKVRIADLVAECRIDHSVGPVADTCGGMKAGYERWLRFREVGLRQYAAKRNNALLDGVSRMSAYLHYGMVSPMRIAREAAEFRNEGAEKYLDELLIWRELAYVFCFYRSDHSAWSAIPTWAQDTLLKHVEDRRENLYAWEQMSRGETSDALWNAAQKSLLVNGELHNNVRMTWGKAVLQWTRTPQQALELLIDLNHRYALDGRDPASYGGILWCLGQFDRPFFPEAPVLGTVRSRPTDEHARRLKPELFHQKVAVTRLNPVPRVAVIGAGIAGAIAARTLADHGLDVVVFEKSRGAGGRMATRTMEGSRFDHGAQSFAARDKSFRRLIKSWVEQGLVARWQGELVTLRGGKTVSSSGRLHYIGVPGMKSVCQHLTRGLDVRFGVHVSGLVPQEAAITVLDESGLSGGDFDFVVAALPAPQAKALCSGVADLNEVLACVQYQSVWCSMLTLSEPAGIAWSAANCEDSLIRWIAREQSKPGRSEGHGHACFVIHSTADWASRHLEEAPDRIATEMSEEFHRLTETSPESRISVTSHRWRYSQPVNSREARSHLMKNQRCLTFCDARLMLCGDWTGDGTVEASFLSGVAAAGRILGRVCH